MDKIKRSYYLPAKLVQHFDEEMGKNGLVRERVVAAALHRFMNASPDDRQNMFLALDAFLKNRRRS